MNNEEDYTWINLTPDEWKKFQETSEKTFEDLLIFDRCAIHFSDFERVDPRDPKLWNKIENIDDVKVEWKSIKKKNKNEKI